MSLPEAFFNPKQAPRVKRKGKKKSKVEKAKAVGHFPVQKILISAHAWAKMS